jgi:cytidylate kinase
MPVVTISRQIGSLGCEIARAVGEQLGCRIIWRELINQAALAAGIPEMALAVIDELGLLGLSPTSREHKAYLAAVHQVVQDLAAQDNVVIVGRAGQVILRHAPRVLHVRLTAPLPVRVERIARRQQIGEKQALELVQASDRARASYLKRFYRVRWDDPDFYHLIINTQQVPPVAAARLISQAATDLNQPVPSTPASPSQEPCFEQSET